MNIAIIPARSGSRRIPNKNVRLFHGKPIIAYSIETARESCLFDEIVVSTDSKDYAQVAKAYGAKVHMRAQGLAVDQVGTQEVARAALIWWQATHEGKLPERACCIYATAPLMLAADLKMGYAILNANGAPFVSSWGTQPADHDAGQWYWGTTEAFLNRVPLTAGDRFFMPAARDCDINTEEDWQRAERMYQTMQEKKASPRMCRSPSGKCDQTTCVVEGACQWPEERPMPKTPAPHIHKHFLVPTPDPRVPELAHFRCECGHILPT